MDSASTQSANDELVISNKQQKEPKMEKLVRTFDPVRGVVSAAELIEILRTIVTKLNNESDIERGDLYHILPGAMSDRLKPLDFLNLPVLLYLMQELGVLRYRRAGTEAVVWQVVCTTFFDGMVTVEWLDQAEKLHMRHFEQTQQFRLARERTAVLEELLANKSIKAVSAVEATSSASPDDAFMVQVAGLEHDLAVLRGQIGEKDDVIAELKRRLAEPPKVTNAAVAAYLASLRSRSSNAG